MRVALTCQLHTKSPPLPLLPSFASLCFGRSDVVKLTGLQLLIGWLTGWLFGWLVGWLVDWLMCWMFSVSARSRLYVRVGSVRKTVFANMHGEKLKIRLAISHCLLACRERSWRLGLPSHTAC